ncbi:hypothetical protein TNCV_3954611 [Trichonephila clavipes]|nr:hypothetical protein TNCV_3954611 [Trichonephila clavipes]
MVRKKKKRHREGTILPSERYSAFAEGASQFAVSGRKVLTTKKIETWIPYIPVMNDVIPATREIKKRKKSPSPENLDGNTVNLTTIE